VTFANTGPVQANNIVVNGGGGIFGGPAVTEVSAAGTLLLNAGADIGLVGLPLSFSAGTLSADTSSATLAGAGNIYLSSPNGFTLNTLATPSSGGHTVSVSGASMLVGNGFSLATTFPNPDSLTLQSSGAVTFANTTTAVQAGNILVQAGGGISGTNVAGVSATGNLSLVAGSDIGSLSYPLSFSAGTLSVDTTAALASTGNIYLASPNYYTLSSISTPLGQGQIVKIDAPSFWMGALDVRGANVSLTSTTGDITLNAGGGWLADSSATLGSAGTGSLTLNAPGSGASISVPTAVNIGVTSRFNGAVGNSGTINLVSGSLYVNSMPYQYGSIAVGGGQTLAVGAGSLTNFGVLSGSGVISLGEGTLVNASGATIAPGSTNAIGTLSVTGAVSLASGSTLAIKVGQSGNDYLNVSGDTYSSGTVSVSELGGYWLNNTASLNVACSACFSGSLTVGAGPTGVTIFSGQDSGTLYLNPISDSWLPTTAAGGNWNVASNWSRGTPGSNTNATINTGTGNIVNVDGTTSAAASSIYIGAGNTLSILSGGSMTLSGYSDSTLSAGTGAVAGGQIVLGASSTAAPAGGQLMVNGGHTLMMYKGASITGTGGVPGGTLTVFGLVDGSSADNAAVTVGTLNIPGGVLKADVINVDSFTMGSLGAVYSGSSGNASFTVNKSYSNANSQMINSGYGSCECDEPPPRQSGSGINYFASISITQQTGNLNLYSLQAPTIRLAAPRGTIFLASGATWDTTDSFDGGGDGLLAIKALGLNATSLQDSSITTDQLVLRNRSWSSGGTFAISGNSNNYIGTLAASLASGSVNISLSSGGTVTVGSVDGINGIRIGNGGNLSLQLTDSYSDGPSSSNIQVLQPILLTGSKGWTAGASGGNGG